MLPILPGAGGDMLEGAPAAGEQGKPTDPELRWAWCCIEVADTDFEDSSETGFALIGDLYTSSGCGSAEPFAFEQGGAHGGA